MNTTIIASLLGIVGVLIGVLASGRLSRLAAIAGAEISDKFAVRIMQRQDFNAAAAKFRDAFKEEFLTLNPALSHNSTDTAVLLEAVFDKHRLAVFDFRPFLPIESTDGFDKAWRKYYSYENAPDGTIHGLNQYSGIGHGSEEKRRLRLLAAERIEKLLYFANHK